MSAADENVKDLHRHARKIDLLRSQSGAVANAATICLLLSLAGRQLGSMIAGGGRRSPSRKC